MVAERLRTSVCQIFPSPHTRAFLSQTMDFNLRGSSASAGFGMAMDGGLKALAVTAATDVVVPAAAGVVVPAVAGVASRLCATRKKVEDKVMVAPQEVVSTPGSKGSPVDDCLTKLERATDKVTDQTNDKTTDHATDKDDQPIAVLKLHKEVKSVMERERTKWSTMLDENYIKIMDIVMYEQRVEAAKTEEQIKEVKDGLDDIRRVVTNRDEGLQAQLTTILQALQLKVVEDEKEKLQENTRATESLLDRDKRDGQPLCWARAAENKKNKDNVQEVQIYTPTNKHEEELEKLVQKW